MLGLTNHWRLTDSGRFNSIAWMNREPRPLPWDKETRQRLAVLAVGILVVVLLVIFRHHLPIRPARLASYFVGFALLTAFLALGYVLMRWLRGFWRVLVALLLLVVLVAAFTLLRLELPAPLVSKPIRLEPTIVALELAKKDEKMPLPGKTAEATWDQWRKEYYQTSQGNEVIPYAWFLALEQRSSLGALQERTLFRSPESMTRYRVLPGKKDEKYNVDGLPIGFTKDIDTKTQITWLTVTCAACHTGQMTYKEKHFLIDGAPSMQAFTRWTEDMVICLAETAAAPTKFQRFARKVLAGNYTENGRKELHDDVLVYLKVQFPAFIRAKTKHIYDVDEGFGRVSAVGRGPNGEFFPLAPGNQKRATGPVNYPPLWYTHDFDWVQSIAAIGQPMGRNMTEAWGVGALIYFEKYRRYDTMLKVPNLFWLETYVSLLQPPDWPQEFGKPNPELVEEGRKLYEEEVFKNALPEAEERVPANELFATSGEKAIFKYLGEPDPEDLEKHPEKYKDYKAPPPPSGLCARCHKPQWIQLTRYGVDDWMAQNQKFIQANNIPKEEQEKVKELLAGKKFVTLKMYRLKVLGTSPNDAVDFNHLGTGVYQLDMGETSEEFGKPQAGVGEALKKFTGEAKERIYTQLNLTLAQRAEWDGHRPNEFRAPLGYPARPLRGYWATAPYLHNGSVPNLYELLSPVKERSKCFWMGNIEYDPVQMGYVKTRLSEGFLFDTRKNGNSNAGHEFRDVPKPTRGVIGPALSDRQRRAIMEYLKSIKDMDHGNPTQFPIDELKRRWNILRDLERNSTNNTYAYRVAKTAATGASTTPASAATPARATPAPAPKPAAPATPSPATPARATPSPATPVPATPAPATPARATPAPASTPAPATPVPSTPAPKAVPPTTPAPTTPAPTIPATPTAPPAPGTPPPNGGQVPP
jgi:hypothetical protein